MVFNYNLFSRYETGTGSVAMRGPGAGGQGWTYMLSGDVATQAGWLYPLALIALAAGLWLRRRAPRTDPTRAGYLMWGLWLTVHAAAFSTGRVAHSFYVVATAPATAALTGAGLVLLWTAYRQGGPRRWLLPTAVLATVAWTIHLSAQYPTFMPWLTPLISILGAIAVALLVAITYVRSNLRARLSIVAMVAVVGALFSAPAVWAASTVDSAYTGSGIGPVAGPVQSMGGPGGGRGGPGGFGGQAGQATGPGSGFTGQPGQATGPGSGFTGQPGQSGGTVDGNSSTGDGMAGGPGGTGGPGGGPGGTSATPSTRTLQTVAWLTSHHPGSRYLLAVQGSQSAGDYIIAGASVLPIGGFTGQVPNVTGTSLAKLVASGELRYVVVGGGMGGFGPNSGSTVSSWVTSNCTVVDDSTSGLSNLYDCKA
jgi:hypothetical protein